MPEMSSNHVTLFWAMPAPVNPAACHLGWQWGSEQGMGQHLGLALVGDVPPPIADTQRRTSKPEPTPAQLRPTAYIHENSISVG